MLGAEFVHSLDVRQKARRFSGLCCTAHADQVEPAIETEGDGAGRRSGLT